MNENQELKNLFPRDLFEELEKDYEDNQISFQMRIIKNLMILRRITKEFQ